MMIPNDARTSRVGVDRYSIFFHFYSLEGDTTLLGRAGLCHAFLVTSERVRGGGLPTNSQPAH